MIPQIDGADDEERSHHVKRPLRLEPVSLCEEHNDERHLRVAARECIALCESDRVDDVARDRFARVDELTERIRHVEARQVAAQPIERVEREARPDRRKCNVAEIGEKKPVRNGEHDEGKFPAIAAEKYFDAEREHDEVIAHVCDLKDLREERRCELRHPHRRIDMEDRPVDCDQERIPIAEAK